MTRQPLHRLLIGFLREVSPVEWVIACATLLLVVQYGLLPRDAFFSPDEGMRVIVSRNLQAESIFTGIIRYENRPIDRHLEFVPYFDQWFNVAPGPELQASYPIVWFAALIAPLYALGGVALAQIFPLFCGALAGLLASRMLHQIAGKGAATLGVIAVMLAIPSSLYSFLLWEHQLALALCLLALACYVEYETRRRAWPVVVGAAAATLACALRIETLFVVAPALLWIGWEQFIAAAPLRRRIVALGAATASVGLLAALYWFIARDTPYRLPALAPALSPAQLERSALHIIRVFVGYDASPATIATLLCALGIGGGALFARRRDPVLCAAIGAGALIAAALITALSILRIEPFRVVNPGLLCGAPLAVLAILPAGSQTAGDTRLRFLRRALITIFIGFAAGAFLTPRLASRAAGVMTQIGSTWGSRYFLALYPLMAVVALTRVMSWMRALRHTDAPAAQDRSRAASAIALSAGLAMALATGILVNLVGLTRIDADKRIVLPGCQAGWQAGVNALVTDDWWRAPECAAQPAPAYLLVQSSEMLPALRQSLFDSGTVELGHASQSGRLALESLVQSLEPCFVVRRLPAISGAPPNPVTRVSLTRRADHCPP